MDDDSSSSSSSMNRRSSNKTSKHSRANPYLQSDTDSQRSSLQNNDMTEPRRSQSPSFFSDPPNHSLFDPHYNNEHRARRARLRLPPLNSRHRFLGDGYDFRRPVMGPVAADRLQDARTGNHTETIDLTREAEGATVTRTQRLPRYGRDIIDISSSEDEAERRSARPTSQLAPAARALHTGLSPFARVSRESPLFVQQDDELEFLRSQPLSRFTSRNTSVMSGAPDGRREGSGMFIDLTEDPDDDLMMIESRSVRSVNQVEPTRAGRVAVRDLDDQPAPRTTNGPGPSIIPGRRLQDRFAAHYDVRPGYSTQSFLQNIPAELLRLSSNLSVLLTSRTEPGIHHAHATTHHDRLPGSHTRRPANTTTQARPGGVNPIMNYMMPAFDLGTGTRPSPAAQNYAPPEPAPEGFTRQPTEDEEVVCPNCGNELAVGEQEAQRQVWIIKQCGHAYCGTCVQARLSAKRGAKDKGKQRADAPAMLRKCVVDGCGKPVVKASMVHVFLSG